jgi:poly(3-hydroxybutyrate) depolymerase
VDVFQLNAAAVAKMMRTDVAQATEEPPSPIGYIDFHGCTCGIASFIGGRRGNATVTMSCCTSSTARVD